MTDKIYCRMVDGLPGEPCKTCGRIVVRKGAGSGMYRLTHAKDGYQLTATEESRRIAERLADKEAARLS